MESKLEQIIKEYRAQGIENQLDYAKFYLYSLITHSTAIEGSTITELENQILFDKGITLKGKTLIEQQMNLDLKTAYEKMFELIKNKIPITVPVLKELSSLVMRNTGSFYHTALGDFSSATGDLRILNVTAGIGGKSYMNFQKVPMKLKKFCEELNKQRLQVCKMDLQSKYDLSFDAHYNLVTIHPWADGNGRMARLIMNWIQFENNLIPAKILNEDKEQYIKALVETREKEDLSIFRNFMTEIMIKNLSKEIKEFKKSMGEDEVKINEIQLKTKDHIINLLKENPRFSARAIAEIIGKSEKNIESHLSRLKKEGRIKRIGPDKGGRWEVN